MSERRVDLERLCGHYGIAPAYHDIWGTRHEVADDHLTALLRAFGVPVDADDSGSWAAAERQVEVARWARALPPVRALRAGEAQWSVTLRLPASAGTLRWSVVEEGGARHDGKVVADSLAAVASAEIDGIVRHERSWSPSLALPAGYHRLSIAGVDGDTLLIAAPAHCHMPPMLAAGGRVWGPSVQLYAVRSERNWGIGDFGDLGRLVEYAAERGAGIVGLNPLHALFAHNPAHASPYSPSSRQRLNILYLDVERIDEFRDCAEAQKRVRSAEFQARLARLRATEFVDHPGVAAAKLEILELLHACFRAGREAGEGALRERALAFDAFRAEGGAGLRSHALFEALQGHLHAADPSVWGWPVWPEAYRDPASPAVAEFARAHAERVEFHAWLQWQAERQLAAISDRCRARGLAVGLYLDMAVSVDRAGSDTWANQAVFALDASVGAPPDEFNPNGQGWGLPPLNPAALRDAGYGFFIETLRSAMRDAGAVRIDHVMGLMRLFCIPPHKTARDGAYVHYALDEMMAIVALESERNRCMVIGEDLGTVADEMRTALASAEILSYRLLYFERGEGGGFNAPEAYPRDALVAVSTHDLATLAGWWHSRDLQLRLELGLFPSREIYEQQVIDRAQERVRLLLALQRAGLLPPGAAVERSGTQAFTPALVEAIHAYVAATPSRVMIVQLEDALGVVEQANMPGTTDAHANWQRKLPQSLEQLATNERVRRLAARLAALRPHPALRPLAVPAGEARIPRATYRLQFHKDFGFDDAVAVLPYLVRLGVSHVYCSPILRARPGSMHGYDIVAHDEINPELGGAEGFARFTQALRSHGLGQLLDMVPNHMGVLGEDNAWWMDVLENGAASAYAKFFDIEWNPVDADLAGKVLVPVLGEHYGEVLDKGELVVSFEADSGTFALRYYTHRFPLDPRSYPALLQRAEALLADADDRAAVSSLATAFGHLPARGVADADALTERSRDKEVHKGRLARLAGRQAAVAQAIAAALVALNGEGERGALHELLEAQAFRLAFWRVASDEINYRRFFDINDLAALRMEDEQVFEATHAFVLELAAAGVVDGLRIDHPDGMYDPAQYFRRLQEGYARRAGLTLAEQDGQGRPSRPLYVLAEKIIAPHEELPETWHLHGSTGYDFAMVANGVLVDASAKAKMDRIWRAFSKEEASFDELAYDGKRAIMKSGLASELTVMATALLRIARADRRTRDYTFNTLRGALAEVAASMPVYRTYIIDAPSRQDLHYVDWAVGQARQRSAAADTSIFDFVRRSMLGQTVDGAGDELQSRVRRFAIRFQQFTSPVAAKGVEDTAFYRYSRLASLNEVGGDPAHFGMSVKAFHHVGALRAERWPHTMLATSTHDHKRSADVRCRIDVLSEMPAAWRLLLRRWSRMNRMHRGVVDDLPAPSPADEYLLYQTLLGTLPVERFADDEALDRYRERIAQYMLKAAREAKRRTGWVSPNEAYEAALTAFVGGLLGRRAPNLFLDDLTAQAARLAWLGAHNTISTTLIKFASPGVPDIYQGHEIVNLTLVDPDNRRPVDYAARQALLEAFESEGDDGVADLVATPQDGRAKLWVSWRLLALRRRVPELFAQGDYQGRAVTGERAEHVIAFTRRHGDAALLVIAGRLFSRLVGEGAGDGDAPPIGAAVWGDTAVSVRDTWPDGTRLRHLLTGETVVVAGGRVRLAEAFARFPGAALVVAD